MIDLSVAQFAFLISFLAGLSSLLGASFIFAFKGLPLKRVALGLGFSAGIMIYLSFFELLPESAVILKDKYFVVFYFAVGALIAYILDAVTHYFLDLNGKHDDNISLIAKESLSKEVKCDLLDNKKLMATGTFVALAVGLHNLPEGVITFTSVLLNPYLGIMMAVAIAIHNIPEGFCVALPIYCSTKSRFRAMFYAFIAGIAEPIGALIAWIFLMNFSSPELMGGLLAVVAGIMFYVAIDELMPAAKRLGHEHLSIFGTILGIISMFVIIFLLSLLK